MSRIDLKALLERADAREVATNIGMQVVRKGSNYYIACPGHIDRLGKADRNIGNAVIDKRGYHCFACNASVGVIDMVVEYTGCSVREAMFMIADMYGGADAYATTNETKPVKPSLTQSDMELIGLVNSHGKSIRNESNSEPECSTGRFAIKRGASYIVYYSGDCWSLNQLYKKDRTAYRKLVSKKAKETMDKYTMVLKLFCSKDAPYAYRVYDLFNVDGYIPDNTFTELKRVCEQRRDRAEKLYLAYSTK